MWVFKFYTQECHNHIATQRNHVSTENHYLDKKFFWRLSLSCNCTTHSFFLITNKLHRNILIFLEIKTNEPWDRKVGRIMCGNPPAKENAQCDGATMIVQSHAMVVARYVLTSARGLATLPHHPQVHNRTDISVLWH